MARLTQADLADLNTTFEERTPQELIEWGISVFGQRMAALSAMQESGTVICHMLHSLDVKINVLFVDTGVSFQETLDTRDRVIKEYGLNVVTLMPEKTMDEQTREFGILYLTPEGQKECCHMRKTIPMLNAKGQYDAMIGSLRRSEGGKRSQCPILAVDPQMNCIRINPLVNLNDEQLAKYINVNNVIVNPLHAQGYPTIGCNRCTTPVMPNEPRRAGRWRHLGPWSVYCGINPTDLASDTATACEFSQDLIDRILGRETDFVI
ncbi:MAG: phosphoadenylyl-sulfate reductase [Planctomycetota bacterium]|nr:phosphoadenylyl-sulfate reductase [Planctomycetota bacterium]